MSSPADNLRYYQKHFSLNTMVNDVAPEVLTMIFPESLSKRKLPCNFDQANLNLFQHELERAIPASQLLEFRNIRVSSEGLLFRGLRILPESFAYPFGLDEWKLASRLKFFATNYLFRRRRRIDAEVLWITDYWSKGYFHWLTDALTRLFVMRDRLDHRRLLLPWEFETRDFVKSSLDAFGVKAVDFIKREEVIECGSLLMPTHTAPSGHFRDEVIQGVRTSLLSAYGDKDYRGAGERIYISRRAAAKRRIANEDEISETLSNSGFQTVYAEELSFEQQVELFSRARYLVSNHGAGLTNMLFMKTGSSVLELRHRTDYINNCYFIMSSALNLNYFYQLCEPQHDNRDAHTADLIVDPKELDQNLTLLLTN